MIWLIEAEYQKDYKIRIRFNDKTEKIIDLEEKILKDHRKIFLPLKQKEYFCQVSLNSEYDTITWPNGADFAPEFLYEMAQA